MDSNNNVVVKQPCIPVVQFNVVDNNNQSNINLSEPIKKEKVKSIIKKFIEEEEEEEYDDKAIIDPYLIFENSTVYSLSSSANAVDKTNTNNSTASYDNRVDLYKSLNDTKLQQSKYPDLTFVSKSSTFGDTKKIVKLKKKQQDKIDVVIGGDRGIVEELIGNIDKEDSIMEPIVIDNITIKNHSKEDIQEVNRDVDTVTLEPLNDTFEEVFEIRDNKRGDDEFEIRERDGDNDEDCQIKAVTPLHVTISTRTTPPCSRGTARINSSIIDLYRTSIDLNSEVMINPSNLNSGGYTTNNAKETSDDSPVYTSHSNNTEHPNKHNRFIMFNPNKNISNSIQPHPPKANKNKANYQEISNELSLGGNSKRLQQRQDRKEKNDKHDRVRKEIPAPVVSPRVSSVREISVREASVREHHIGFSSPSFVQHIESTLPTESINPSIIPSIKNHYSRIHGKPHSSIIYPSLITDLNVDIIPLKLLQTTNTGVVSKIKENKIEIKENLKKIIKKEDCLLSSKRFLAAGKTLKLPPRIFEKNPALINFENSFKDKDKDYEVVVDEVIDNDLFLPNLSEDNDIYESLGSVESIFNDYHTEKHREILDREIEGKVLAAIDDNSEIDKDSENSVIKYIISEEKINLLTN
jgi:hypothetical protein